MQSAWPTSGKNSAQQTQACPPWRVYLNFIKLPACALSTPHPNIDSASRALQTTIKTVTEAGRQAGVRKRNQRPASALLLLLFVLAEIYLIVFRCTRTRARPRAGRLAFERMRESVCEMPLFVANVFVYIFWWWLWWLSIFDGENCTHNFLCSCGCV